MWYKQRLDTGLCVGVCLLEHSLLEPNYHVLLKSSFPCWREATWEEPELEIAHEKKGHVEENWGSCQLPAECGLHE